MDDDIFQIDRPLLFSIAYRMLGSASDAEDVLQDAWLRYRGVDRSTIRSLKALRGKAYAARRPLVGRDQVLNFLIGLHRTAQTAGLALRDVSLTIEDVNSEPALILRVGQRLESIFVFSIDEDAISEIRVVRNPAKLTHVDRKLTTLH